MLKPTFLLTVVAIAATHASADDAALAKFYGRGVHSYYAGDYIEAHRSLTLAINNGTKDPRAYYFRGLVYDITGRSSEAESDYRLAANLEVSGSYGPQIGRALVRVQGSRRLVIERIRQDARLENLSVKKARIKARYKGFQTEQARVLRKPLDLEQAPTTDSPPEKPAPKEDMKDPFSDGDLQADKATVDSEDALENPFSDDAKEEAADDNSSDILGESDEDNTGGMDDSDPFSEESDDSDPFGGAF